MSVCCRIICHITAGVPDISLPPSSDCYISFLLSVANLNIFSLGLATLHSPLTLFSLQNGSIKDSTLLLHEVSSPSHTTTTLLCSVSDYNRVLQTQSFKVKQSQNTILRLKRGLSCQTTATIAIPSKKFVEHELVKQLDQLSYDASYSLFTGQGCNHQYLSFCPLPAK